MDSPLDLFDRAQGGVVVVERELVEQEPLPLRPPVSLNATPVRLRDPDAHPHRLAKLREGGLHLVGLAGLRLACVSRGRRRVAVFRLRHNGDQLGPRAALFRRA